MRRALQIGAMSAANIGSIVLFNWVVLTNLGPGVESDALFAGMTVPQLFASVVSASLTHALAPLLAGERAEDQHQDGWTMLVLCGSIFVAVAALLGLTATWWVPWTVPGFTAEGKALTVLFAQISIAGMVFTGLNAVQTAIAFAQNRFIWSDAAPTAASLAALALLILLMPRYGAVAAAWIAVLRLFLQSLLLMRGMGRPVRPDFARPAARLVWNRLRPLVLGASYYKMDPLVDRFLLSTMAPGSLSLLYLSQQLFGAASQIVGKAFAVPAITRLSVASKKDDGAEFAAIVRRTFLLMSLLCILAVAGLVLVGRPVLADLLTHGRFGLEDSHNLWWLLVLTSGMFVAGSLGTLTSGAFYATGDTKTPTVIGAISFTLAIGIKVLAFIYFGLAGLALAISFYYLMSLAMMTTALYRRGLLDSSAAPTVTNEA